MADNACSVREPSKISRAYATDNSTGKNNTTVGSDELLEENIAIEIDPNLIIDLNELIIGPRLSERNSSTVYEGWYKNMPVAIKVIESDQSSSSIPDYRERFEREVTMLSRLNHDNIVKLVGASVEQNMIVTELMRGGSLKMYLRDTRPASLDLETSLKFAIDIAQVMGFLHANGIIHRDLKPGNLLLSEDRKLIKLADFGLAREETLDEMMSSEVGTYRWMAPELCSKTPLQRGGKKFYDRKVDVYSFAIVFWELLTNCTPFKGMGSLQAAFAVSNSQLRPSLDNIREELIPFLKSCWDQNPENRPEFSEIVTFLSNYLDIMQAEQQVTSPPTNMAGHQGVMSVQVDSPGTRHLIDDSGEDPVRRPRRKKSPNFLCCKCLFM